MTTETFQPFLARREAASLHFINGRAEALLALSTDRDPATFFPPGGERIVGAAEVTRTNAGMAAAFEPGGTGRFDILQSGVDGDLGFWAGVHRASVRLARKSEPVEMELRTTEIFRREEGEWKLVHRHADRVGSDED